MKKSINNLVVSQIMKKTEKITIDLRSLLSALDDKSDNFHFTTHKQRQQSKVK